MSTTTGERTVSRSTRTDRYASWSRGGNRGWRGAPSVGSQFGTYFFLSAMIIIFAFLVYTQIFVVGRLKEDTLEMVKRYAFFYSIATRDTIVVQPGPDLNIIFETIRNTNFPVVITDEQSEPQLWKAIGIPPDDYSPEALEKVREIVSHLKLRNPAHRFEIPHIGTRVLYYGDPSIVTRLSWLPWVALGVLALFIGVGYVGFQSIRKNEQRSIWIGLAREAAHQLGTPLSSLYGWIELMKSDLQNLPTGDREEATQRFNQIVDEMGKDTSRLDKIASRFSQIGSVPALHIGSLNKALSDTVSYLRGRLPEGVRISQVENELPPVPMNRELLGWAFENLLKNAADAMEGKGGQVEISAQVREESNWVDLRFRDDGKGIPHDRIKQIFLPGYSTKKRGWGLGLAFVKRIIEDYHSGKIIVLESIPEVGTTFQVSLPMAQPETPKDG